MRYRNCARMTSGPPTCRRSAASSTDAPQVERAVVVQQRLSLHAHFDPALNFVAAPVREAATDDGARVVLGLEKARDE